MLLGKLNTPATKAYQINAFETTIINSDYLAVKAEKYVIGESQVKFELRFGNIITNEDGEEHFDIVLRNNVVLTTDELSTWGTDDSIVLDIIAAKFNNSIVEKVQKEFHYTY